MPRTARLEIPGAIHHVSQRGNNRLRVFVDDVDRRFFLRMLTEAAQKHRLRFLSYCLMDNHFHLVVETPEMTLGRGMRLACGRYVSFFNERHATGGGRLYQARFHSKVVTSDAQFGQLLRYLARNPVSAGMCAAPEDWPWSSHAAQLGNRNHPLVETKRVTELLTGFGGSPSTRYAQLFDADGPLQHIDADLSPWDVRPALAELVDVT